VAGKKKQAEVRSVPKRSAWKRWEDASTAQIFLFKSLFGAKPTKKETRAISSGIMSGDLKTKPFAKHIGGSKYNRGRIPTVSMFGK
tara:strand:- start:272 stop:529 length:258 start_codon:yes stop_codon:yes gene_type:complete